MMGLNGNFYGVLAGHFYAHSLLAFSLSGSSTGNNNTSNTNTNTSVGTWNYVTTYAVQPGIFGNADGQPGTAQFYYPNGISLDNSGNVYVADTNNNSIRKITPDGLVSTYAIGISNTDFFNLCSDVVAGPDNKVYIAD